MKTKLLLSAMKATLALGITMQSATAMEITSTNGSLMLTMTGNGCQVSNANQTILVSPIHGPNHGLIKIENTGNRLSVARITSDRGETRVYLTEGKKLGENEPPQKVGYLAELGNEENCRIILVASYLKNTNMDNGKLMIIQSLEENNTSKMLILSHTGKISIEELQALSRVIRVNKTLNELELNEVQLDDEGVTILADALKRNVTITALELNSNQFGLAGIAEIAGLLKVNKTVKSLSLSENSISEEGMSILAEGLQSHKNISDLGLCGIDMSLEGMHSLSAALKGNEGLERLGLSSNSLCRNQMNILGEIIRSSENLTSLNLMNCAIDDELSIILVKALCDRDREKSNFLMLSLDGNMIGDEGALALAEWLKRSPSKPNFLCLYNNRISEQTKAMLANEFGKNIIVSKYAFNSDIGGFEHV